MKTFTNWLESNGVNPQKSYKIRISTTIELDPTQLQAVMMAAEGHNYGNPSKNTLIRRYLEDGIQYQINKAMEDLRSSQYWASRQPYEPTSEFDEPDEP